MRKFIVVIVVVLTLIVCVAALRGNETMYEKEDTVMIGKTLYFSVDDGKFIDAQYLKSIRGGEHPDGGKLDALGILRAGALDGLISYMEQNGLKISAGNYILKQTDDIETVINTLAYDTIDNAR